MSPTASGARGAIWTCHCWRSEDHADGELGAAGNLRKILDSTRGDLGANSLAAFIDTPRTKHKAERNLKELRQDQAQLLKKYPGRGCLNDNQTAYIKLFGMRHDNYRRSYSATTLRPFSSLSSNLRRLASMEFNTFSYHPSSASRGTETAFTDHGVRHCQLLLVPPFEGNRRFIRSHTSNCFPSSPEEFRDNFILTVPSFPTSIS